MMFSYVLPHDYTSKLFSLKPTIPDQSFILTPTGQCQQLNWFLCSKEEFYSSSLRRSQSTSKLSRMEKKKKKKQATDACSIFHRLSRRSCILSSFFLFCFHTIGFSRLFIWGKWLSIYSRHLYLQELAQTSHIFGLVVIRTFALYTLPPLKTCQRHQAVLQPIIYSAVQVKLGGYFHQPFKIRY